MKKYKYYALSENASEQYYTKKEALKDLINFGNEEVRLYALNASNNYNRFEVTSEDLIGKFVNGKRVI